MQKILLGWVLSLALLSPASAFNVSPRVIGGVPTTRAYPFMATVWGVRDDYASAQLCGGVLVAPNWVVTAAHCALDESTHQAFGPAAFEVYLGQKKLLQPCDLAAAGACTTEQTDNMRQVDAVYLHKDYQNNGNNVVDDIALLHLVTGADPAAGAGAALSLATTSELRRLQQQYQAGGHGNLRVLGWGKTTNSSRQVAQHLQVADLDYVPTADCGAAFGTHIANSQVCAVDPAGARDTCNGDSGGPLMVQQDGQVYLLGLTSFGDVTCATKGVPSVYTSIPYYLNWIEQHINAMAGGVKTLTLATSLSSDKLVAARDGAVALQLQVRNLSDSQTAHHLGFRLFASAPVKVIPDDEFSCGVAGTLIRCSSRRALAPKEVFSSVVHIESASMPSVDRRLDIRVEPFADEFNLHRNKTALAAVYFEAAAHFDTQIQVESSNAYSGVAQGKLLITNRSSRAITALRVAVPAGGDINVFDQQQACMPLCDSGPLARGATRTLRFSGNTEAVPAALVVSAYAADARGSTELESYFLPARLMRITAGKASPAPAQEVLSPAPQHGSSGGGIGWWALLLLMLLGVLRRG